MIFSVFSLYSFLIKQFIYITFCLQFPLPPLTPSLSPAPPTQILLPNPQSTSPPFMFWKGQASQIYNKIWYNKL